MLVLNNTVLVNRPALVISVDTFLDVELADGEGDMLEDDTVLDDDGDSDIPDDRLP